MNVEHNGADLPNRQELFDSLGKFPLLSAIFGAEPGGSASG